MLTNQSKSLLVLLISFISHLNIYECSVDCNIGNFKINRDGLNIVITNNDKPNFALWSTEGVFISAGNATVPAPPIVNGNFQMKEIIDYQTTTQTIAMLSCSNDQIIYTGLVGLTSLDITVEYQFTITSTSAYSTNQLQFIVSINDIYSNQINRIFIKYLTYSDESFHGFGESFTSFNLKGKRIPILVSEQGVGRGEELITSYLNDQTEGVGGHWYTTYAPKPLYLTNQNRSIVYENSEVCNVNCLLVYTVLIY
jgi:alpha-glucosidase